MDLDEFSSPIVSQDPEMGRFIVFIKRTFIEVAQVTGDSVLSVHVARACEHENYDDRMSHPQLKLKEIQADRLAYKTT